MERSASDGCYEGDAALGPEARRSDFGNRVDEIQRSGSAHVSAPAANFLEGVPGQLLIFGRYRRATANRQRFYRSHRVRECKKAKGQR